MSSGGGGGGGTRDHASSGSPWGHHATIALNSHRSRETGRRTRTRSETQTGGKKEPSENSYYGLQTTGSVDGSRKIKIMKGRPRNLHRIVWERALSNERTYSLLPSASIYLTEAFGDWQISFNFLSAFRKEKASLLTQKKVKEHRPNTFSASHILCPPSLLPILLLPPNNHFQDALAD